jgi:hypothetical protein
MLTRSNRYPKPLVILLAEREQAQIQEDSEGHAQDDAHHYPEHAPDQRGAK